MSEVRDLFRFCPSYGRRFHVRLVSKKLTNQRKETMVMKKAVLTSGAVAGYGYAATSPIVVEEDVPLTIDEDEFQYTYKCKHCGHVWSEVRTKETKE